MIGFKVMKLLSAFICLILVFASNITLALDNQFTIIIRNGGIHDINMDTIKARIIKINGYSGFYKNDDKIRFHTKEYPVLVMLENGKVFGKALALDKRLHHGKMIIVNVGMHPTSPYYELDVLSYEVQ